MIFLDNASTTKIKNEIISEIEKSCQLFFNPSAVYSKSLETKKHVMNAKEQICNALGVTYNDNLIITGSATEANNLAIIGSARKKDAQYIFSQGEHPSVYNCALELKNRGYNVVFAKLKQNGEVDIDNLSKLLENDTCFVSIMHVSNETGAINDIYRIVKLVKSKQKDAIIHCDGVQAFGKFGINVANLGVDMYTISAHKFGGPKGIGALYVKDIKKLKPIIFGGGQEFGLRSGTENVQYILAFGKLCENLNIQENYKKVDEMRKYIIDFFSNKNDVTINSTLNGSPYITSISFEGVRGETLVHMLEEDEIYVGTGSACSSKKGALNRTLEAMGKTKVQNEGAIRISLSSENSLDEIKFACEKIYEKFLILKEKLR